MAATAGRVSRDTIGYYTWLFICSQRTGCLFKDVDQGALEVLVAVFLHLFLKEVGWAVVFRKQLIDS